MARIFINLNENEVVGGWSANISTAITPKGAKSSVAIGESEIYNTKAQAWATIQQRASQLNYTDDEVSFNSQPVNSYNDVVALEAAL
ncbi:hypothetical protein [Flavobacterium sp.]|jgi:hypothetical protein|uniref:hypothetical protein n=1 Tax=Flavobacterium sp. TaxID=239 RepID=UPI0037BF23E5